MCSSVAATTTNSTTNKTIIVESFTNSYLDFLQEIFTQLYQTGDFTNSIGNVCLCKSRQYKKMKTFVDKKVEEMTEVFKFEEMEKETSH